jgi:hypothetical protein
VTQSTTATHSEYQRGTVTASRTTAENRSESPSTSIGATEIAEDTRSQDVARLKPVEFATQFDAVPMGSRDRPPGGFDFERGRLAGVTDVHDRPSGWAVASRNRQLLTCGLVAGVLFIGVTTIQILTRPGFDLRRLAISVLALGDFGWVQISNFILSGLLTIAFAVGVRRTLKGSRAGTVAPILIAANGLALIVAGGFTTDAGLGFPPGAPDIIPDPLSWHAQLHSFGFFLALISIVLASLVFARRFAGLRQWRWFAYCAITATAMPALVAYGMTNLNIVGVAFFAMAIVMTGWNAAIALHLRSEAPV